MLAACCPLLRREAMRFTQSCDSLQAAIRAAVDKLSRLDVMHNNTRHCTARDDTAVNRPLDEFSRAINLDPTAHSHVLDKTL